MGLCSERKCSRCHNIKSVSEYEPRDNKRCVRCVEWAKDYYQKNKAKRNNYSKNYYDSNKARLIKQAAEYTKNNPQIALASSRKWREKNRELARKYVADWGRRNKHKRTEAVARRRQRVRRQCESFLSEKHLKDIRQIYKECEELNATSKGGWHVDHVVPLNGNNVCGLHVPWNLRVIPATENLAKSNIVREEFLL